MDSSVQPHSDTQTLDAELSSKNDRELIKRVRRLLTILLLLQSRTPEDKITATSLAERFDCSKKTTQRDLKLLAGQFDLFYDESLHTYILSEYSLPTLSHLTINDARNLGLIQRLLMLPGMPQQSSMVATLERVIALLPEDRKRIAQGLEQTIALSALPRDYSQAPIGMLETAIKRRQTVRIDYESRRSKSRGWREVDPYQIEPREGIFWELHAWCHSNREFLTFAMDRVHQVELTSLTFRERQEEWQQFRGREPVGGLRGDSVAQAVHVQVRFTAPLAPYVAQAQHWPNSLAFITLENGELQMTGNVPEGDPLLRLVSLLLSFRSHVRVEGGPQLLQAFRSELQALAESHGLFLK